MHAGDSAGFGKWQSINLVKHQFLVIKLGALTSLNVYGLRDVLSGFRNVQKEGVVNCSTC